MTHTLKSLLVTTVLALPAVLGASGLSSNLDSPFVTAALNDLSNGGSTAAACMVKSDLEGSGVLVDIDGVRCVLTVAHNTHPTLVSFPVQDDKTGIRYTCHDVKASYTLWSANDSSVTSDLQVLFLASYPNHITPLSIGRFDPNKPSTLIGYGQTYLFNHSGGATFAQPIDDFGRCCPAKVSFPSGEIQTHMSLLRVLISKITSTLLEGATYYRLDGKGRLSNPLVNFYTEYRPGNLQTHVGAGYSGGPIIQDGKLVALYFGGNFRNIESTNILWRIGCFSLVSSGALISYLLLGHSTSFKPKVALATSLYFTIMSIKALRDPLVAGGLLLNDGLEGWLKEKVQRQK